MLELRELGNDLISKWDRVVYSSPGGTIFHTLKWLKLLEKNQAVHIRYIGIFMNQELVGVFPLCIKKYMFVKVAGSPFFVEDTPYMGPIIARSNFIHLFSALDAYSKLNRLQYVRIITNDAYNEFKNTNPSYQFAEKDTWILDLTKSEDDLWKSMEGRCRTAIRKAQKSKVIAKIIKDRSFIDEFYYMLQQVFLRHGKHQPTNSKAFYYDLWDNFGQSNAIFLAAEHLGEVIAGAIVVLDRKRAYYLSACSKNEFRSLSPNNLIQWEAIRIAKESGVELYDLLGPNSPSLTKFKKSFGSLPCKFTSIERAGSKWIRFIRNKYPYYKQKLSAFAGIIH